MTGPCLGARAAHSCRLAPRSRAGILLALAALLAAACGPTSQTQESSKGAEVFTRPPEQQQALQCEPGKEHYRASGPPIRGGVYNRGVGGNTLPHLDLSQPGGGPDQIAQVYRRLVRPRSCFYEDLTMQPDMARSWEVSPDGLSWTFKLRQDIRWHNKPPVNGRPFTSADVAWNIEMQKQRGQLRSSWIDVVHEEPDPYTAVLRLKESDADFLTKLGTTPNFLFPREVLDQLGDFKTLAVGTGPFMLKEFRPRASTTLERNPDWPDKGADGKPLPYLDEVRVFVFEDNAAELAAANARQLDFFGGQALRKNEADALLRANPKLRLFQEPVGAVWGIHFNVQKKPFDDVRVRRAIALAINHDEIIEGPRQGGAIRTGFLPVTIQPYAWSVEKAKQKFQYDLEGAKRLLAQAGFGPGALQAEVENQLNYNEDTEVAVAQLKAAGIDARQKAHPSGVNSTTILNGENFSGILWGAISGASNLPDRWFGAPLRSGAPINFHKISDPKLDALSLAQARELDPVKRRQIIDQLQDYLYEVMPFVPSNSLVYYRFYSCRVQNMRPTHFDYNREGLEEAWLDAAGC